jgi:predicted protein tyrosine phosphatase
VVDAQVALAAATIEMTAVVVAPTFDGIWRSARQRLHLLSIAVLDASHLMFIEEIQRHVAVCAQIDLPRIAKMDPNFWNVVSIREPTRPKIPTSGFKKVHTVIVYDADTKEAVHFDGTLGIPRPEHLQGIFQFADSVAGESLLVHCWAGVSRSTAVALALIAREMYLDAFSLDEIRVLAPEILLVMRRQAAPNPLLLEFGLAQFLLPDEAHRLALEWVNHPTLFANRMGGEPSA